MSAAALHYEYWTQLSKYLEARGSGVAIQPKSANWVWSVRLGPSFRLTCSNNTRDGISFVGLEGTGAQRNEKFEAFLSTHRAGVDRELGSVDWKRSPQQAPPQATVSRASNLSDRSSWPALNEWFATTLEHWTTVLTPLVQGR